jgi:predicted enzyme related to lactoylglutathione lyase
MSFGPTDGHICDEASQPKEYAMPKIDEHPVGNPCWIELFTSDTDKARAFYGELFGWTAEEMGPDYGNYINLHLGGRREAGLMHNDGSQGAPETWNVYLATADVQTALDAAASNGGQVLMPAMDVMDLGRMGMVADPGGAAIGLWQAKEFMGLGVLDEPGAPSWFELHTREFDKSVDFYRKVFAWDTHEVGDTDEFRYTTLGKDDNAKAGIMDASQWIPAGEPAKWSIYFATKSVDDSLKKVEQLGGKITTAAEDTPYGRLAEAADPTGVRFKLRQT